MSFYRINRLFVLPRSRFAAILLVFAVLLPCVTHAAGLKLDGALRAQLVRLDAISGAPLSDAVMADTPIVISFSRAGARRAARNLSRSTILLRPMVRIG
jgi:hypothetical protein